MRKSLQTLFALLMALALVAGACKKQTTTQQPTGGEEKAKGGVLNLEITEPAQLNPAQADDSEETIVSKLLFEGLVVYDQKNAEVKPGVALKWTPSENNTIWTFDLRKDATFGNKEKVTAQSFIDGWNRASSPVTGEDDTSPLNTFFAEVKGFKKHFGDSDVDPPTVGDGKGLEGLKAVDDYTLQVTLDAPDPEFYLKTGHTAFQPLPSKAAQDAQKPSFSEQPIGNGPFELKGDPAWKHDQEIRLQPRPGYKGGWEPSLLDEVVFHIYPDQDTMYLEWEKGNLDYIRVPPGKIQEARTKYKDSTLEVPTSTITYVGATLKNAPLDNVKFRQALSLAINRKEIIASIFDNSQVEARSIVPPTMPGFRKDGPCKFCRFDVAEAKKLLQESGADTSKPMVLAFNTGAGHEQWVQAVANQLKTNLGLTVTPEPVTGFSRNFIPRLRAGTVTGLFRLGWGMDYPSPQNFLAPLFSKKGIGHDNLTEYDNPKFDELLDETSSKPNVRDRIKGYQEAEDIILNDMPIIPLWFRVSIRTAHLDRFGGLGVNPFDDPSVVTTYLKKGAPATPTGGATPASSPAASPAASPS